MSGDEMTWDDGLSMECLGTYLRRVAPDAMPLLLYCIDCSRYFRHSAFATNGTTSNPNDEKRVPKTEEQLAATRNELRKQYLEAEAEFTLCRNIRVVMPAAEEPMTNEFLQEIRAEAQHLLVVNYFQDFLRSEEYVNYLEKEREMKDSKAELAQVMAQQNDESNSSHGPIINLEVSIPDTTITTNGGKQVVQYNIRTVAATQRGNGTKGSSTNCKTCSKRYSEFFDFNLQLRKQYTKGAAAAAVGKGSLPGKGTPGGHQLKPSFVEERRSKIEAYLTKLVEVPELMADVSVLAFLNLQ
jgi:hypothetical protein